MNKKNLFKLLLDISMVIVLVLMYSKRAINMSFHEIGGLILLGVFLIHILINWKWVVTVTKKLFSKSVPFKTKFGYVLNIFLFISFALIGISGIFISKVVFHVSLNSGINWKIIHYTASACALVFIGIHMGLHYSFITGMFKKILPMPQKVRKALGIVLTILIFSFGCYSLVTTSFSKWLIMPFTTQQMDEGHGGGKPSERPETSSESAQSVDSSETTIEETTQSAGTDQTIDSQSYESEASANSTERTKMPEGMERSSTLVRALQTIANYFSSAYVFATITVILEMVIKNKK